MFTPQQLSDRAEVADIVARLSYTQDDKDFAALVTLFDEVIDLDLSGHLNQPQGRLSRPELAELSRSVLAGFTATQHLTSNVLITLDGDTADCRVDVMAYHHVATEAGSTDYCTMRNNWRLLLNRRAGRWVIGSWTVASVAPADGNPGVYKIAAARAANGGR